MGFHVVEDCYYFVNLITIHFSDCFQALFTLMNIDLIRKSSNATILNTFNDRFLAV